ncbi:MAG TPA: HPP family protein [Micrococcaceae bacterium]
MAKLSVLQIMERRGGGLGAGTYAGVLCLVLMALAGSVALLLRSPWLFPSLGPTVMLFFESPKVPAARPLNTLVGHGVGLAAGALCLYTLGLDRIPSAPLGGLTPLHLVSGAVSVALTTFVLSWLKLPHPPAGATTLIVSLGILGTPAALASMAGAVILVTAVGWGLNILLGTRPAGAA